MPKFFALAFAMFVFVASPAAKAEPAPGTVEIWRNAGCGCCGKWADHLQANGFKVAMHEPGSDKLQEIKKLAGITEKLESCHTAKVGGYVVEGHVPAADVKRLLAEKPDALGLSLPGMPVGSPGMESDDGRTERYEVLLVKKDGSTEVFARH
ncbi:MAG: DUF411 domain-containing protein [Hyphomicrobiales bacterium]